MEDPQKQLKDKKIEFAVNHKGKDYFISEKVDSESLEDLIECMKKVKKVANDLLTELVNEEQEAKKSSEQGSNDNKVTNDSGTDESTNDDGDDNDGSTVKRIKLDDCQEDVMDSL